MERKFQELVAVKFRFRTYGVVDRLVCAGKFQRHNQTASGRDIILAEKVSDTTGGKVGLNVRVTDVEHREHIFLAICESGARSRPVGAVHHNAVVCRFYKVIGAIMAVSGVDGESIGHLELGILAHLGVIALGPHRERSHHDRQSQYHKMLIH